MKTHPLFAAAMALVVSFSACQPDAANQSDNYDADPTVQQVALNPAKPNFDFEGTLNLTASLDNQYCLAGSNPNEIYLLVNVQGARDESQKDRTPLNISVVLDRSGSMSSENKLEYAKDACKMIIENMALQDKISVVTYDDEVDVVSRSAPLTDKGHLKRKVSSLRTGGMTNLSGGMLEGFSQVQSTQKGNNIDRVLLLSDGLANRGITGVEELQKIVKGKYDELGIAISTFGVGLDYDEDLLTNLAEYGRGNYYYIGSADKIPELLAEELQGLLSVIAQNTQVSIEFPGENLTVEKVYGYKYEVSGNKILVDYNDVFSEELKSVLIKFKVNKPIDQEQTFKLALSYDDVLANYNRVNDQKLVALQTTNDQQLYETSFNSEVKRNCVVFEATETFERAAREVDNGNYDQARRLIRENVEYMDKAFEWMEPDSAMQVQYEMNASYATEIDEVETMSQEEISIMQKASKNSNYMLRKKKIK